MQAARVSYGEGTRQVSDDRGLIRYLLRHRHTTPFEMAEMKLLVRVPMDCWRQWIRHRTANRSTNTAPAIPWPSTPMQTTPPTGGATPGRATTPGQRRARLDPNRRTVAAEPSFTSQPAELYQRATGARRGPRASPQGPAAVDLYRSLLEVDLHNLLHLPAPADGRAMPNSEIRAVRHDDRPADRAAVVSDRVGSVRRLSSASHVSFAAGSRGDRRFMQRMAASGQSRPAKPTSWPCRTRPGSICSAVANATSAARSCND